MKYKDIIEKMTLEEKASLCSGSDMWHTKGVERVGIPSVMVTDGPHGLRKQGTEHQSQIHKSVLSTCFPTASCCASTWNRELIERMGKAIGEEAKQEKVSVVLGPGANIKRSSICGRNFEYYSEDPLLSGKLAGSFIRGVQSQGVGTSLKHFFANNQETRRMTISSEIDERASREIYLRSFEYAVKEGKPRTLMCSYNKVNGEYCCEDKKYLNDILRDEWGFEGLVMSDWGATNERPKGLDAGLELEMPSSGGFNDMLIVQAVKDGKLDEKVLDRAVDRILSVVMECSNWEDGYTYDVQAHNDLAGEIASEGGVLLKNQDNVLPLDRQEKILVVGEMAVKPRYQGAGSSHICPTVLTNFVSVLEKENIPYEYTRGYDISKSSQVKQKLVDKAVEMSKNCDKVVVFAGLTDQYEAEGYDRKNIDLPLSHLVLIDSLVKSGAKVIVVLASGSVVAMPFKNDVQGILLTHLGGQNVGKATFDMLYGVVNPSGKLAETYPLKLEDIPSYHNMLGDFKKVEYRESIYVGYRYFATSGVDVAYPFGYGLSYTRFEYSELEVENSFLDDNKVKVSFLVKNVGSVDGKEIIQCYVHRHNDNLFTPKIELKQFDKIALKAGESKHVELELDKDAFSSFVKGKGWVVVGSDYDILIGASSQDIRLSSTITIQGDMLQEYSKEKKNMEWYWRPTGNVIPKEQFETLLGRKIKDDYVLPKKGEFTVDNTFEEMEQSSGFARFFIKVARMGMKMTFHCPSDDPGLMMMVETMRYSRVKNIAYTSQGALNPYMAEGLVKMFNGHFFKGLGTLLKNIAKKAR